MLRWTGGVHPKAKYIDIRRFYSPWCLINPTFQRCGFKRDACSNIRVDKSGFMRRRDRKKKKKKTLVRLCLVDILIQPGVHEAEVSHHRDGNAADEAALKRSDAESMCVRGGLLWRLGAEGASNGDQDRPRSSASSPDLRPERKLHR